MLFHRKIPKKFCPDAVNTAAYIRDRCTSNVLNGCTKYGSKESQIFQKFCESYFENVASAEEGIRKEIISVYHNFERDFHVIYPDDTDDDDNLQVAEPVEDTDDDNLQAG